MPETLSGERAEALREFDDRLVSEAGENHVFQAIELVTQGGIDACVAVAEQVDPPGADRVEITVPVGIDQPRAFAAKHRQRRKRFVNLHLGARVPHGREGAIDHFAVRPGAAPGD